MIPYYNYYDATQRLKGTEMTIDAMGGPDECPDMVVAQKEFLELEVEYYKQQSWIFTKRLLFTSVICVIMFVLHHYGVLHV
jgi:hypothetical protein